MGTIEVTIPYWRSGATTALSGTASTEISIFVRQSDDSEEITVKDVMESPSSVDGSTVKTTQFAVSANTDYDIGIELLGDVSSLFELSASDFAIITVTRRRRLEVEDKISIKDITL